MIRALASLEQTLRSPAGELFAESQDLLTRETLELAREGLPRLMGTLRREAQAGGWGELYGSLPEIGIATEKVLRLLSQQEDGRAVADALVTLLPVGPSLS